MPTPDSPLHASLLNFTQEPWANKLGATRTIAAYPQDTDAPWHWRLSLATLSSDAPFSSLPQVHRTFTLASAGPVNLAINGTDHELRQGMQACFAGEDEVRVEVHGRQQYALNLMVRTGRGIGTVQVLRAQEPQVLTGDGNWSRIIILEGQVLMGDGTTLGPLSVVDAQGQDLYLDTDYALIAQVRVAPALNGQFNAR